MKRKYKKALQDCFEPPAPQRKAQFLQQIQAEQSQDTATPLFFQQYPKWIRQSAMVFCAAAVLGIGYGAYQAFFDSRDQLEVVPPQETTTTAWIDPATTTVTSQSMTSFTAETTRTTVTMGATCTSIAPKTASAIHFCFILLSSISCDFSVEFVNGIYQFAARKSKRVIGIRIKVCAVFPIEFRVSNICSVRHRISTIIQEI